MYYEFRKDAVVDEQIRQLKHQDDAWLMPYVDAHDCFGRGETGYTSFTPIPLPDYRGPLCSGAEVSLLNDCNGAVLLHTTIQTNVKTHAVVIVGDRDYDIYASPWAALVLRQQQCANPSCPSPANAALKTCSRCKSVRYCSVRCQKAHHARHHADCLTVSMAKTAISE